MSREDELRRSFTAYDQVNFDVSVTRAALEYIFYLTFGRLIMTKSIYARSCRSSQPGRREERWGQKDV
jgi:hypothetical protein